MSFIQDKGHITIDGNLFLIARQVRGDKHYYGREEAPQFVNKFGSGDPNYRDATFYPHFVQNNWLNGFDQEKFNDGGKFFRSSKVNPTKQEKLTLERATASVGTITGEAKCFGLRSSSSQGWYDTNYGYRQQLTVSAPVGVAVPAGHPVKITIDTAALQTASKLLANRNDWRVVYFNGTSHVDLSRDYIDTTTTFFGLQAAIAAGQTDNNYYVYYGYSSASTNKQPTTEAEWNAVYGMFDTTPDANTKAIYHAKEGSGTSVEDSSSGTNTGTLSGSPAWGTDGKFGRYITLDGTNDYLNAGSGSDFNLNSMTIEGWFYVTNSGDRIFWDRKLSATSGSAYRFQHDAFGDTRYFMTDNATTSDRTLEESPGAEWGITTNTWHHIAFTYDGTSKKVYVNGVLKDTVTWADGIGTSTGNLIFGAKYDGASNFLGARIQHLRVSNVARTSFPYVLSSEPTYTSAGEIAQAAVGASGTFEIYAGSSTGGVYLWDGTSTWTEVFNVRRVKWFDTVASKDTDYFVGDQAGTERAQAQSFQVDTTGKVKAVEVYIKKANGTPSSLQVRIETNNAGVPSGTLVDANLSKTVVVGDISSSYAFHTVEFPASASLSSGTTYWLVLKTAAAANDQNYNWGADASSPSFSSGNRAHSADGGSTWTADTAADFLFRVLGESTQVNQIVQATFSSTAKLYFATGDPTNTTAANARIYTYDGTSWVLNKTFTGVGSAAALCLQVYGSTTPKLYVGLAPTAAIYSTSDGTTWASAKDIDEPNNPGYVWDLEVYNGRLYAAGGHPEYAVTVNSQGFLWSFDETSWSFVHDFSFTVIKSLCVYDSLLFLGTINKNLFVYNTASMDKLIEFPWDVSINHMTVHDDKLMIALDGYNSLTGYESIYSFDRNGFHEAYLPTTGLGYNALLSARNQLFIGNTSTTIYQVSATTYVSSGTLQMSYFEAGLPNVDKLIREVTLQYEEMQSGCSIALEYKTDESDASWTAIGTADNVDTTQETFTLPVTLYAKKISYRITLATSDNTKTPTLKVIDTRYVLAPDFKYLWKMKLACPDNIVWADGSEPYTTTAEVIDADEASLDLTDASGFPTQGRAVVVDGGVEDEFTWTGKSSNTLTGCSGLSAHASTGLVVKMTGATLHKQILTLKQAKQFYTFIDIDGLSYTVLFHQFQSDDFTVNPDEGIENNIPITLLQA